MRVGGETVTDPARDVDESSGVEVDRRPVVPEPREVWIVNKPAGVVSTAREPGRRPAVVELVDSPRRLYPVGRLDADSTGLILLTNDGELANRLTHPRYGVERALPDQAAPSRERSPAPPAAKRGSSSTTGRPRPPGSARVSPRVLEMTLGEGRNRQVRRMVEAVGNQVVALTRVRFGSLELGNLPEGGARRLRPPEVKRLWKDSRADE